MKGQIVVVLVLVMTLGLGYEGLYGVVSGGTIHQFTPQPYGDADWIYFSNGIRFNVKNGEPNIPAALILEESNYYIVHCAGPVYSEYVSILESTGARVYSYISNQSFLVKMDVMTRSAVDNLGFVDWIGIYQPAYKISGQQEFETLRGVQKITILLYPDAQLDEVIILLEDMGAVVDDIAQTKWDQLINCEVDLIHVREIARIGEVNWIEPWHPLELDNDNVQWIVQTASTGNRRIWDMGITGAGELVSTCDSGIRTSHYAFRNTTTGWITTWGNYPSDRKVIAYDSASGYGAGYNDFGDESSAHYHGSHTAGTVCGNDDIMGSPSTRDGVALNSRIYFCDAGGALTGNAIYTYPNLNDLFSRPYTGNAAGSAKLMSNSWGGGDPGAYDSRSANVDQFMWDHKDFLVFFSNGNDGPASGSVHSPATAKNCVSVGGCQNASSFQSIYTFSSRGPTDDGRIKPTILTPGQNVYSAYGGSEASYWSMDGTSMAAPSAQASAALVRQYFTDGWYPTGAANPADSITPSAALMKAMLVNSADPSITNYTNVPNFNIGWGRIDLDSVLYFAGDSKRLAVVDEVAGLSTGQFVEYTYNINSSSVPLRVALVWTDYPAIAGIGKKLINDLHLTVTDPGNNQYKGNVYASGQSVIGGSYDTLNVEECMRVNSPPSGNWTIRVDGFHCPYGPQPFAIVVTGDLAASAQPNVVYQSSIIDDAGGNNNGRVDPGETVEITVTLKNNGTVDATNATGTLRASSPDITLIDSVASYGTILANGGTGQGTFEFSASLSIPQGTVVPMTVYLEANGGSYTTNCNFQIVVGLPRHDYVDHDTGNCRLTVTKHGSIGYLDVNSQGSGFVYPLPGTISQLFHASFALANASNYVMDQFYPNAGPSPNNTDWLCTTVPDGRCWIDTCTACAGDEESWAMFSDSGFSAPKGLIVTQHGYAWDDACYDDFVIIRFEVKNEGAAPVSDIHAGVIADYDMTNAQANRVGTDVARRLAYMWYPTVPNPYVGVKLLWPTAATNVTALQNPVYVYSGPTNLWHDTTLYKFLNGTLSFPSGPTDDDWSVVVSTEPFTLGSGEISEIAFAFIGGSSLADLQANADSAQSVYIQYFGVEEATSSGLVVDGLVKFYPNPFSKNTTIAFNLTKSAKVRINVYNALGQLMKTVIDDVCEAGESILQWNGRDDRGRRLPNGVYFYSLETDGYSGTGKMIILH
ncbi:MAG: S8 family serine peptidase [candidate division WOR-3 bacterium]|nr:MAG: S8 family serine peptidase [candidate division WOR-3 bacterium]